MNMDPECVPCLLGRVFYQANLCNPESSYGSMKKALEVLSEEYLAGKNSAAIATKVHKAAYDEMGVDDPYLELKIQSYNVASSILGEAEEFIASSENNLAAAVKVAIAGNVMDFGVQGLTDPEHLSKNFNQLASQPLAVNDVKKAETFLGKGKKVLYLLDNCGEDVLDILLVKELQKTGTYVTGVVKGEPILTDVTMSDADRSGISRVFDKTISTQMFAVGVSVEKMKKELLDEIGSADLVISKGMGNFEALSDSSIKPILYLFRAKCNPVAKAAGVLKNDNVAKLIL